MNGATARGSKFYDRIAFQIEAENAVSEVVGPGRLHRCRDLEVIISWAADTTAGVIAIEGSHHQDFPGTPEEIATVSWSAGGKTDLVQIEGIYPFIRCRLTTASDGDGVTIWMQGR